MAVAYMPGGIEGPGAVLIWSLYAGAVGIYGSFTVGALVAGAVHKWKAGRRE